MHSAFHWCWDSVEAFSALIGASTRRARSTQRSSAEAKLAKVRAASRGPFETRHSSTVDINRWSQDVISRARDEQRLRELAVVVVVLVIV